MTNEIHILSDAEIDAVAGGLQYNDNPQNYVMRPPPVEAPVVSTKYYDMASPY
jgi:hypothetical protein